MVVADRLETVPEPQILDLDLLRLIYKVYSGCCGDGKTRFQHNA